MAGTRHVLGVDDVAKPKQVKLVFPFNLGTLVPNVFQPKAVLVSTLMHVTSFSGVCGVGFTTLVQEAPLVVQTRSERPS